MTVKQLAETLVVDASAALERAFAAMPAERQTWQPDGTGRSALDIVRECGGANHMIAEILVTRSMPERGPARMERLRAEIDTPEKALGLLHSGTEALTAAIREFPEERLDERIVLFGRGEPQPFAKVMVRAYWHMSYHDGQINYIQTLYGNAQRH